MSSDANYEKQSNSNFKYFRMFIFSSPMTTFMSYSEGLNQIFEELAKTKLPTTNEFVYDLAKEQRKMVTKSTIVGLLCIVSVFKFRSISLLNRIFFSGVIGTGLIYFLTLQHKENILNKLILSQTHYGQEARILTKYFIPDHKQILTIQNNINEFRNYISDKKKKHLLNKSKIERLLKEEEILDDVFIQEITEEIDNKSQVKK